MPAPASESEYAPISPAANRGRKRCFWSSLPCKAIVIEQSPTCTQNITEKEGSTLANSSTIIASEISSMGFPPYSSGIVIPCNPYSQNFPHSSRGGFWLRSRSRHVGAKTSSAKSLTISRIMLCSSVSAKSISITNTAEQGHVVNTS